MATETKIQLTPPLPKTQLMPQRRQSIIICLTIMMGIAAGCAEPETGPISNESAQISEQSRFTITLAQYNFDDRVEKAQLLLQRAKTVLKTENVWLERQPGTLFVNYGRFAKNTSDSPIHKELKKVKKLYPKLETDQYQFCFIREIEEADPSAPKDWNLLNQECYYSLEIGTYCNVPEKEYYNRKADAVQAVKAIRESGDPAFFVHGKTESRVYVGCMPSNVTEQFLKLVQQKYPFRFENGAKVFQIEKDTQGHKGKLPQPSVLIEISFIKNEKPF